MLPLFLQMGTNYKAALTPQRIRETIHGLAKAARRKRRHGNFTDDSTIHTDTNTVMSLEEDDHLLLDILEIGDGPVTQIELQPAFISMVRNMYVFLFHLDVKFLIFWFHDVKICIYFNM